MITLIDLLNNEGSGYDQLLMQVKYDCQSGSDCFNPEGCPKEYPNNNGKRCSRDYCDKFKWIIDRAKHYGEKLGVPWETILDKWENDRKHCYIDHYKDKHQPRLDNAHVRVFETLDELKSSIQERKFRCPLCGEISDQPDVCSVCDWKIHALFQVKDKSVYVFCKEKLKGENWFMPVAWE